MIPVALTGWRLQSPGEEHSGGSRTSRHAGPGAAALEYIAGRVAAGRWEVPAIAAVLLAAHTVLGDYPQIGQADAMTVVLAREFRTDVIATLDRRHFRIIRPMTRHDAFRLLPDDVPEA